jgi:DNA polymerase
MIPYCPYCDNCPRKYRPIEGDGPQPAQVLIVGERPGRDEQRLRRVFVGKTGQELNETYLPRAGWKRCEVRVVNAVRCWADNNRTPTDAEVVCCGKHHLPGELERTEPLIVMLMGGSACRLMPGIKLDTQHGIPFWGKLYGWEGIVVPMYHPALGLHESRWMTQLLEDWEGLGDRLRGLYGVYGGVDGDYQTDYRIARGREVNEIPLGMVVAIDTETHGNDPYSVQFSPRPGLAYMVLSSDAEGIGALGARLRGVQGVLHNALHDLADLERMGIVLACFRDTMQEAYHLGNLPQGLKPLVYRLFGYNMTSWEDIVLPYSIEALTLWMVEALEIAHADLSLIEVKRLKTKVKETVKRGPLEQLLHRLIRHVESTGDYDPWLRLDEFWNDEVNEWMTAHIEARIGKYPILGIGNAPIEKATRYACGDADWTGQVARELERRRKDSYWQIRDGDAD